MPYILVFSSSYNNDDDDIEIEINIKWRQIMQTNFFCVSCCRWWLCVCVCMCLAHSKSFIFILFSSFMMMMMIMIKSILLYIWLLTVWIFLFLSTLLSRFGLIYLLSWKPYIKIISFRILLLSVHCPNLW